MTGGRMNRDGQFSIAILMVYVAAFAVAALGARHFRQAIVEGLPENSSSVKDYCVLSEYAIGVAFISVSGAICGYGLGRSGGSRPTTWLSRRYGRLLLASVLILACSLSAPIPEIVAASIWGGVFASMSLLLFARDWDDPSEPCGADRRPHEENPAT